MVFLLIFLFVYKGFGVLRNIVPYLSNISYMRNVIKEMFPQI